MLQKKKIRIIIHIIILEKEHGLLMFFTHLFKNMSCNKLYITHTFISCIICKKKKKSEES